MAKSNRRRFPRQNIQADVQVYFSADNSTGCKNSGDLLSVSMGNQSENGLYIETDRALPPGSNVNIKMVAPQRQQSKDAYLMRDGRVVWCKKVDDDTLRFGVGVQVLRKVVRADILTSRFR